MTTPLLLALDMSSVAIGYVVRNGTVLAHGTIYLNAKTDIGHRCDEARFAVQGLLGEHRAVDAVVIESPVARFASAVIPQARLSGAVLAHVVSSGLLWLEIAPKEAKRALCGDGNATKREMLEDAAPHFGYALEALTLQVKKGKWGAYEAGALVYNEDAADALGLALAAEHKVKVS